MLLNKDKDFNKHLNFSKGLSNSIESLENNLMTIGERLNGIKRFENETKASLLEQITQGQNQIYQPKGYES